MKKLMDYIFLIILMSVISMFIIMIGAILDIGKSGDLYYNKFLSNNVKTVQITDASKVTVDFTVRFSDFGKDYTIIKKVRNSLNQEIDNIQAIYSAGKNNIPNLLSGRYFTQDEFNSNAKVCVIGKYIAERSLLIENDKEYYDYMGVKYEVIGHIGLEKGTDLDSMVWLNMNAYMLNAAYAGNYCIDGIRTADINSAFNNFTGQFDELTYKYGLSVKETEPEKTVPSLGKDFDFVFTISIIILFINILIANYQYINKKIHTVAVKKLCGASKFSVIGGLCKNFVIIVIIGYIIGAISYTTFLRNFVNNSQEFILADINIINLITSFIVILMFTIIIIYPMINKVYKTDVSLLLKD